MWCCRHSKRVIQSETHLPVPNEQLMSKSDIDQALRQSFEQVWVNQQPRGIATCLPPEDSASFLPTLVELVGIDLFL